MEEIEYALKWLGQNKKPLKSVSASLKWAAKEKPIFEKNIEEIKSKRHKDALKLETTIFSDEAKFIALSDRCEVTLEFSGIILIFEYGMENFSDEVNKALKKYKFRVYK